MENPPDVIAARAEWTKGLHDLAPGTHVVVVGAQPGHCAEGRRAGLEFRDTIVVSTDRGTTLAALFRKPLDGTVIEQVLRTGTGGIWIDGCRTGYQSEAGRTREANATAAMAVVAPELPAPPPDVARGTSVPSWARLTPR